MIADDEVFAKLDASLVGYETSADPIIFQTKDSLVQWQFELPIPTVPGSVVKYSFMTTIGDISFCAKFFDKEEKNPEVLIEACRVPSDVEPIMGSFRSRREGTLILYFDNSFSWLNPKLLTYKVALFQPAFAIADEARSNKSRNLLKNIMVDIRQSETRLLQTQDKFVELEDNIVSLEEKIAALEEELAMKKQNLLKVVDEGRALADRIYINLDRKNGLSIRLLTKPLLIRVLGFLGGSHSSAASVCKYWLYCAKEANKLYLSPALLTQEAEQPSSAIAFDKTNGHHDHEHNHTTTTTATTEKEEH